MKRYPHIAILTVQSELTYSKGKRGQVKTEAIQVSGRYDPVNRTLTKNVDGNEVQISGEFYTRGIPCVDGKIVNLRIKSLGIDAPVIGPPTVYQSHLILTV